MNILSKAFHAFARVFAALGHLNTPEAQKKVEAAGEALVALAAYVLPAARLVADLTPSPTDDLIVWALGRMQTTAAAILSEPDPATRKTALLRLATTAAERLLDQLTGSGTTLDLGSLTVTSASALARDAIETAVKMAYSAAIRQSVLAEPAVAEQPPETPAGAPSTAG